MSFKNFKIFEPSTNEEWKNYFYLRWKILREPWKQSKGSELDDSDRISIHRMIVIDDQIVGVGRLHFNSRDEAQIRYMGIDHSFRQKKLGSILLMELEKIAFTHKATKVILHSREYAIPFYKANGYKTVSKTYLLFNEIQHYLMEKSLH